MITRCPSLIRFLSILGVVLFSLFQGLPGIAADRSGEAYLLIERGGVAQVMRVNDPAGEGIPLGCLATFAARIIEMAVAPDRTIHLIEHLGSETWEASTDKLLRQVFDGPALKADWGWHSISHSDGRSAFGADEALKPIFRSIGAPHSTGPGLRWAGEPPVPQFGVTVCEGKPWYAIPNGSWYQQCEPRSATGLNTVSFPVFHDRLEVREHLWRNLVWREGALMASPPMQIGRFQQLRLTRFVLNGCLETCGNVGGTVVIEEAEPRAHLALEALDEGCSGIPWLTIRSRGSDRLVVTRAGEAIASQPLGDARGDWFVLTAPAVRSLALRFGRDTALMPWVVGESLVEGKDGSRPPLRGVTWDPDLMAVSELSRHDAGQRLRTLAIGNRAAGRIFRLVQPRMDGAANAAWWIDGEWRFSPDEAPLDLRIDRRGTMTMARLAVTPGPQDRPLFERDGVAILEDGRTALGQAVSGRLVMARRYRLEVLQLAPGEAMPKTIASIPLGVRHFAQRFLVLGGMPQVGSGTIADQIPLLMRAGARFENGETPAPEFVDTWSAPERVLLAVIDDPTRDR